MPLPLRAVAAAGAALALGASAASAASWSAPQFPRSSGAASPPSAAMAQPMALAQSANGAATLLYRGANTGIYAISRSKVSARWGNAVTWLPAKRAKAGAAMDAVMSGSRVWAMWTQFGNKRLLTTTGTRAAGGKTPIRGTNLSSKGVPSVFEMYPAGSRAYYGLTVARTGAAYGGPVSVGRVPSYVSQEVVPATVGSAYGSNAAGQQVALLFDGTSLSWSSRSSSSSWTAPSTQGITAQIAIGYAGTGSVPPSDIAIDEDGNAAVAWVSYLDAQGAPVAPGVTPAAAGVLVSTRSGAGGAFGAPMVAGRLPAPTSSFLGGIAPQVSNLQVAMGGGSTAVSWMTMGDALGDGPPLLWASIGATGGALPAPTQMPDPLGMQDASYEGDSYAMSVNARGMAAIAFGWGMSQGQMDGLFATTSAGPGQPWMPLKEVSRCAKRPQGASGGYGDIQLMPFTSGFTLAFACNNSAPAGNTNPNGIGITTYR